MKTKTKTKQTKTCLSNNLITFTEVCKIFGIGNGSMRAILKRFNQLITKKIIAEGITTNYKYDKNNIKYLKKYLIQKYGSVSGYLNLNESKS